MYNFVLHASRCTNNCVFCGGRDFGNIAGNIRDETAKLQRIIDAGGIIEELEISGNDPCEYPGIAQLVEELRLLTRGSRIVLLTHGKTLGSGNALEDLIAGGVTQFVVPVYGHVAQLHDAITQTPGSFDLTMDGIAMLEARQQPFRVTSLITRENQEQLEALFLFLSRVTGDYSVGVPHYASEIFRSSAPDLRQLKAPLSRALRAVAASGRAGPLLRNIPHCLIEFPYDMMEESHPPASGYEYLRSESNVQSGYVRDVGSQIIPQYRVRSKSAACSACAFDRDCGGFYEEYIKRSLFEFDPIPRSEVGAVSGR